MVGLSIISLTHTTNFLNTTMAINDWLLSRFGWLFSVSALFFLTLVLITYFSPLGKYTIGGQGATPILTKWRWFSITLCTTIATGILFWGTAEPLFHLHQPPPGLAITGNTDDAARFALSTMYLHWTFLPYGIYTLVAMVFALMYYNKRQPFSLGSLLYPLLGRHSQGWISRVVDAVSLFSLIAGMAASLGAGLIILAGGLETMLGIPYSPATLALMALLIVATFILSAVSGLMKGIRILSDINIRVFIVLGLFILVTGPTAYILTMGAQGLLEFATHFFSRSLIGVVTDDIEWARSWTMFNWANWLAWTPITAIFLGRIGLGYTVREFIHINLLFPALFAFLWMTIFSSTALYFDIFGNASPLYQLLIQQGGVSKVIFQILAELPWSNLITIFFIFAAFLSYVTAADSNTSAMSGISSTGISPESPEPSLWIKVAWGITVGTIAWVMIAFSGEGETSGLDGIRMLSNLGGLPALILVLFVALGLIKMIIRSFQDKAPG
jgi:choline-glycine betaine transporter